MIINWCFANNNEMHIVIKNIFIKTLLMKIQWEKKWKIVHKSSNV